MVKKGFSIKRRNELIFYSALLFIPLLQFCVFYIYVNINSIILAFQEYSLISGSKFTGLANFKTVISELVNNTTLQNSLKNTFLVFLLGLAIGTTLPLCVSYYIYKKKPMSHFFRIMLFLPSILSSLVLVLAYKYFLEIAVPAIWLKLFDRTIEGLLYNPKTNFFFILFYTYWFGFGANFLLYLSAMAGISESVVESAKLEGVTPFQEFIHITLPLIYPTVVTFIIVNIGTLFANQLNLYSIYEKYAPDHVQTIGYYLYKETAIADLTRYPYLSAFGLLCTVVAVPLSFGVRFLLNKIGPSVE